MRNAECRCKILKTVLKVSARTQVHKVHKVLKLKGKRNAKRLRVNTIQIKKNPLPHFLLYGFRLLTRVFALVFSIIAEQLCNLAKDH
jgi:hypothetical protein